MYKLYTITNLLIGTLLTTLLLQGCSIISYIKTNDVRNEITKFQPVIKQAQLKIQKQNNINASLFSQFEGYGYDLSVAVSKIIRATRIDVAC